MNDKSDETSKPVAAPAAAAEPIAASKPAPATPLKSKPTTPVVPMERVRPTSTITAPVAKGSTAGPLAKPIATARKAAAALPTPKAAVGPATKIAAAKKRKKPLDAAPITVAPADVATRQIAEKTIETVPAAPAEVAPMVRPPVRVAKVENSADVRLKRKTAPVAATSARQALAASESPRRTGARAPDPSKTFAEAASAGLDRSRETYAMMRNSAERVAAELETSAEAASKGLHEMRERMLEAWREQAEATLDFIKAASSVRSLSDAVELNATHARRRFESTSSQVRDIAGLAGRALTQTGESVRKAMMDGLSLRR